MNQKILWKIEELWKKHYQASSQGASVDISSYAINAVSNYYPKFHLVDTFSFKSSEKTVFRDAYGDYKGLEKQQLCLVDEKPIYLFDNHNEILFPLVEMSTINNQKYEIVHIDAHPDDAIFPEKKPTLLNIDTVKDFIPQTLISDFFDAVSETNILGKVHRITHSDSFEFFVVPEEPYLLSLDIDIFGPEGDFAEREDKIRAIAKAWSGAAAVCIATSPGFIDQEFARGIIEVFMGNR